MRGPSFPASLLFALMGFACAGNCAVAAELAAPTGNADADKQYRNAIAEARAGHTAPALLTLGS
jgi:hypothetical protein